MKQPPHQILVAVSAAITLAAFGAIWAQQPPAVARGNAGGSPFGPLSGLKLTDVVIEPQPKSAGRGAPLPVFGPQVGPQLAGQGRPVPEIVAAKDGATPAGITPLDRDIFSTTDFYADKDLWMDPRYYRCASATRLESTWGALGRPHTGNDFPRTVAWGFCDRDTPVDQMQSPYPYKTAQAHFEALKAEAASRGGPTIYSWNKPPPNWNGEYLHNGFGTAAGSGGWLSGASFQIPTYLKLLTPEYQQRFVQQMYHDAHDQIVWPGAYCWPEGFMRWWFDPEKWLIVTPDSAFILGRLTETLLSQVNLNVNFDMSGSVPNLLGDNRQWLGDTIGFWDKDALITWTSNIKGWLAHGWFEWSRNMQAIDIYTPINRKDNGKFIGLYHETILYDPEALAKPLRIIQFWEKSHELNTFKPFDLRQCAQNMFPINGIQSLVNPGETHEYTVPDLNGRPWADIWTKYFEKGMKAPAQANDPLAGFQ